MEGHNMEARGFFWGKCGSSMVEHGLLLALVALAIAATLSYMGIDLRSKYYQIIAIKIL
jgi:Flp pilus assembly pilin Flp